MSYQKKHDAKTTASIKAEFRAGRSAKEIAEKHNLSQFAVLGIIGGNTRKTTYKGAKR